MSSHGAVPLTGARPLPLPESAVLPASGSSFCPRNLPRCHLAGAGKCHLKVPDEHKVGRQWKPLKLGSASPGRAEAKKPSAKTGQLKRAEHLFPRNSIHSTCPNLCLPLQRISEAFARPAKHLSWPSALRETGLRRINLFAQIGENAQRAPNSASNAAKCHIRKRIHKQLQPCSQASGPIVL